MKLKELLKKKLSKKELSLVSSSFDVVGDIAIIDIPDELVKKEKIIAETLLNMLKNVKVVCKKAGIHKGVFRTQKLKVLAGEKRKETIHKENDVRIKIDVEKVYFSSRLSTERKRIYQLVKPGESVLVMFSGCAPYPCVIAKNSQAKYVYGIEINPEAHKLGVENLRLNKLSNVFLINDDVRKAIPVFYQKIIGLKSAIIKEEMSSRLKHNPSIIELHTFKPDFEDNFDSLRETIKEFIGSGKSVIVHQPHIHLPMLDMTTSNMYNKIYKRMVSLIDEFDVGLIIHFSIEMPPDNKLYNTIKKHSNLKEKPKDCNSDSELFQRLVANVKSFKKYYNNIFFENSCVGAIRKKEEIIRTIKATGIKNICIDTCHLLYNYPSEDLVKVIEDIQKHCNTYFHLNDYKNHTHGSRLNESSVIKLENVLPLVTKGITEIISGDEVKAEDMISSWQYLRKFKKQFDRILMPLPKGAEDFLELALMASKKGTVIHFYDFLKEDEFYKAEDKIREACNKAKKKYKLIRTVKCGQFSPGVFRICADFRIV